MTDITENQDTVLVAEYTLGLMEPSDAKGFAERLTQDAGLRTEYIRWTEYFAKLSDEIEAVEPPEHLKASIQKRLFGESEPEKTTSSWFNFRWVSGLVLASILAVMVFINAPDPFTPTYSAQLTSEDSSLKAIALYDLKHQSLKMASFTGTPAFGRDFELWVIVGDQAPVSLGVMTSLKNGAITIPAELTGSLAGATLALSDEPEGGSPTGSPTGAVLVAATIQAI